MSDDLQEKFNQYIANKYIAPLMSDYPDIVRAMSRGELNDAEHRRLRQYLETNPRHAGFIAGVFACRMADPGTPMFEWGVNTVRNKFTELYSNRELQKMPDLFASFTLAMLRGSEAGREAEYEINVWRDVRDLLNDPSLRP